MSDLGNHDSLHLYATYPFSTDEQYQQGLASILAGSNFDGNTEEEQAEILRRTRVFYFNKVKGHAITLDEARAYEQGEATLPTATAPTTAVFTSTASSQSPADSGTRVLSFTELQELIETGKVDQIPNNKIIPEAFSDAPPSESTAPVRKKPWELASPVAAQAD